MQDAGSVNEANTQNSKRGCRHDSARDRKS